MNFSQTCQTAFHFRRFCDIVRASAARKMDTNPKESENSTLSGIWDWQDVAKDQHTYRLLASSYLKIVKDADSEANIFHFEVIYDYAQKEYLMKFKYLTGSLPIVDIYFELKLFKLDQNIDQHHPYYHPIACLLENGYGRTKKPLEKGDERFFTTLPVTPYQEMFLAARYSLSFPVSVKLRLWIYDIQHELTLTDEEPTLDETMRKLCLSDKRSDLKIRCDGQDFPVHKFIIGARSDVFERMFSSRFKINEDDEPILEINDASAQNMKAFLKFLYKDEIKAEDINCDLLRLADKYNVNRLVNICLKHLQETIDVNNVVEITFTAYLISKDKLLQSASNFIFENRGSIKKCDLWDQITKTHPEIAIKIMDLIVFDRN